MDSHDAKTTHRRPYTRPQVVKSAIQLQQIVAGGTPQPSDARLKRDAQKVATLDSGLSIHSFRYLGDDRRFLGVIAQDLLADNSFRDAVSVGEHGYYEVDYSRLGLGIVDSGAMSQASHTALRQAAA